MSSNLDKLDYLAPMFLNEYVFATARAKEIVSYKTLIHPFDEYVWCFTMASAFLIFATICILTKLENFITLTQTPKYNTFEGYIICIISPACVNRPCRLTFQTYPLSLVFCCKRIFLTSNFICIMARLEVSLFSFGLSVDTSCLWDIAQPSFHS